RGARRRRGDHRSGPRPQHLRTGREAGPRRGDRSRVHPRRGDEDRGAAHLDRDRSPRLPTALPRRPGTALPCPPRRRRGRLRGRRGAVPRARSPLLARGHPARTRRVARRPRSAKPGRTTTRRGHRDLRTPRGTALARTDNTARFGRAARGPRGRTLTRTAAAALDLLDRDAGLRVVPVEPRDVLAAAAPDPLPRVEAE